MASDSEEIEYQSFTNRPSLPLLTTEAPDEGDESDINFQEEQGFMVHMSPDANKSQWNHVDDLDKFFVNVYDYHQRHGFQNIVLAETLQLLQFIFIVVFATYLNWCVSYAELFDDIPHNQSHKKTFDDIIIPSGECISRFDFWTWFLLVLCFLFLIGRSIKMLVNFSNYVRTRNFFISALNIQTSDLSNMTWHEVQSRLLEVQKEEQICIHKQELTNLDIYHRILRFKNYMVALVNKDVVPVKMRMPVIGEHAILTHGMRFNLDFLIYWSPWSIFVNSYTMRPEFKSHHKRRQLADQLSTHIAVLAVLNLVLCPLIFLYQIVYFFLRYTTFFKRSPAFLGSRQWANYGRVYLRHFNELDHELDARLNRAYLPSKMYMDSFQCPPMIIMAKYIAFFAGAPASVLLVLGILDFNDVTKVEHLVTLGSICGMVATVCSNLIPDENTVYHPERLMLSILAHIHYMPDAWKGKAHTSHVREEFSLVFQYKIVYILEELLSPLITPFWLFFSLRPRASQMVDFFRCFTVDVAGVGDVCSFAQMDIKKHGNPEWTKTAPSQSAPKLSRSQQAENGKIELSLIHFAATNPEWKPPPESTMFVEEVKEEVQHGLPMLSSMVQDVSCMVGIQAGTNMTPLGGFGSMSQYRPSQASTATGSTFTRQASHPSSQYSYGSSAATQSQGPVLRGGLSHQDSPVRSADELMASTLTTSGSFHSPNYMQGYADEYQRECLFGNMSLSVLHMHEAYHTRRSGGGYGYGVGPMSGPMSAPAAAQTQEFSVKASGSNENMPSNSGGINPYNNFYKPPGSRSNERLPTFSGASSSQFNDPRDLSTSQQQQHIENMRQELGPSFQQDPSPYSGGLGQDPSPYATGLYSPPDLSLDSLQPFSRTFYMDEDPSPSSMAPLPPPPPIMPSDRLTSQPMAQIREDSSGEHEVDTAASTPSL